MPRLSSPRASAVLACGLSVAALVVYALGLALVPAMGPREPLAFVALALASGLAFTAVRFATRASGAGLLLRGAAIGLSALSLLVVFCLAAVPITLVSVGSGSLSEAFRGASVQVDAGVAPAPARPGD